MKSLYCSFKFIKRKYNFLVQQYVQLYFLHFKLMQVYSHYKNLFFFLQFMQHTFKIGLRLFIEETNYVTISLLRSLVSHYHRIFLNVKRCKQFHKVEPGFFFRYQFRLHIDRCANLQYVYLSAFNTRFLNRPSTVKPGFVRILSICKHRQASIVSFSTLRISINTFVFHKITRLVGPSTPTETDLMNVQILLVPARL